jgi:hypothetical protein
METFKFTGQNNVEKEPNPATQEELDRCNEYLLAHPEKETPEEGPRGCEQEVIEFRDMVTAFEAEHSVEELYAIIDLTPEDAPNHPVREPARKALNAILAKLNILMNETNITPGEYEELEKKWKYLSNAVGMINRGKVYHDR